MTVKKIPKLSQKISVKKRSKEALDVGSSISPHLAWVYPFLLKAKRKMPSLTLPKQIRPFKPTKNKIMRVFGNVYFEKKLVMLATHTQQTCLNKRGQLKVKKIIRLPKAKVLDTLAHELAHLRYQDHGYEHEQYTRMIFKTFDIKEKCPYCRGSGKIHIDSKP
ncbi:MAG: hypothetical protein HQM15_06385 [Deltaproteobacteria bacterium]|nr:hypothetical protein [Deltaproteobacteria bacterium]